MKKRITILTIFLIMILISIISLTILYIRRNTNDNNQTEDTGNIYNTWNLYKQEAVNNGKVIQSFEASGMSLALKSNGSIDICYEEETEKTCLSALYEYNNNSLVIEDNTSFIKGKYKVKLEKDKMNLESKQDNDKTEIIFYFERAEG